MNVYGDPKAGDSTARIDGITERASRKFIDIVMRVGPKVMNRPAGSKVLSPQERREEYRNVYQNNPEAYAQLHKGYVEQHGFLKGTAEYAKYVKRMEQEVNNG